MIQFIPSKHDGKLIQVHLQCNVTNNEAPAIIIAHPYGPLGIRYFIIIIISLYT